MPDVTFRLSALGRTREANVHLPDEPVSPHDLMPLFLGMSDAISAMYVEGFAEQGRPVTCTEGCSACCRQLVGISELDALHLQQVVGTMPEERRTTVERRFREARAASDAILTTVRAEAGEARITALQAATGAYFQLNLDCPFLENNRCSIYADRPARCREHYVITDPELCNILDLDRMKSIRMRNSVADAFLLFGDSKESAEPRALPLLDALDYQPEQPAPKAPAAEILNNFLQLLDASKPNSEPEDSRHA